MDIRNQKLIKQATMPKSLAKFGRGIYISEGFYNIYAMENG